ncbi:ATP-dependent RNA helicase dbp6 [Psilocybe cubensis]|uniref:ATP-dependent RNA helicase n=2 Tax=Psilocybe cubensis TaxID=181762 RepID=A0A8H8CM60_PSICU|nr:ATP-dependent RNA helicase dbp6 [Psilocybe cubensis]KAH9481475.1 ATP-dependent RNA helicase dbp6 [Psilocybe cubensis]
MSGTASANVAPITKEKTKSKQRYLKRKKERRKIRTKSSLKSKGDDKDESEDEEMEDAPKSISLTLPEERNGLIQEKTLQRSKKRSREEDQEDEDVLMATEERDISPSRRSQSPELVSALPSFPLPALPNAPSKSDLALQGLDQALIGAEWVSPTTVLPIPIGKDDGGTRLSERTRMRLRDIGITELFAVQTALLPFLLPSQQHSLYLPYSPPRDVCVSAPTGSGKTLAYVLPIIETLSSRVVTRLRALIVLPTRDLVAQVRETIEVLSKGTKLKVGTATGQHSFAHEQSQLVQDKNIDLLGGSSKVDILICTPGRLIDHLVGTPNFSLQHLRFLVVDEADRLLAQSFQGWLAQVLAATRVRPTTLVAQQPQSESEQNVMVPQLHPLDSLLPDGLSPTVLGNLTSYSMPSFFTEHRSTSCQKLLFSATLTRDPGKISTLELRNPKYFIVQGSDANHTESNLLDVVTEKFSMPATLNEHMIVSDPSEKPLVFFHLVHTQNITNALVFTKSTESTIRLVRLFEFFEAKRTDNESSAPLVLRAYSSDLPSQERKSILEQFKEQKINILVCSDLISRGIDISHVSHVVSYDVPVDMRKYVHRVGRTARAGRTGDAWTLVEQQEARYFKQMLKNAGHLELVKRVRINAKDLAPLLPHYEAALNNLKEVYTRQS